MSIEPAILFKAYKDNVVLVPEKHARQTEGGLYIPDTAQGTEYGRRIIACRVIDAGEGGVGEDGVFYPVEVEVGERVLVEHDAGELIIIGEDIPAKLAPGFEPGTELRVVRHEEIVAVIEDES